MLDVPSSNLLTRHVPRVDLGSIRSGFWSRKMVSDLMALSEVGLIVFCGVITKIAYIDWYLGDSPPLAPYLSVAILGAIFAYIQFKKHGLYKVEFIIDSRRVAKRILLGLCFTFLFLIAIGYLIKDAHFYSRGWLLTWFVTSYCTLIITRQIAMSGINKLVSQGYFQRSVAIYGAGSLGQRLFDFLLETKDEYAMVTVGMFDDQVSHQEQQRSNLPLLGGLEDLIAIARNYPVDRIIIALPASSDERITHIFERLSLLPCDVHLCPDIASFNLNRPSINYIGPLGLLEVQTKPIGEWNRVTKFLLDYIGSMLALIALSPVYLLTALAIKLDSTGPVFFRQRRHGFNHEIIDVLKFRTMSVMENGSEFSQATPNDRRVTRVGKFLRRTSIDELPQFWNVLRGEMSIVGPRPHAIAHNEQFFSVFQDYAKRHKVKPGITGWAQVNGYRGETNTEDKMRKRVNYDLDYIKNWTIWFDLKIMLYTAYIVLSGTNAH